MGYRSEVKSLIYGTPEEMEAFKLATFDLYNQVWEDFAGDLSNEENDKYQFLYLNLSYMKWYDEYEEVQHWDQLLETALMYDLAIEFVRVGEEQGDLEVNHSGNSQYYLEVIQRIDVHIDR